MWPGSGGGRLRLAALIPATLLALWLVFLRPPLMGGDTTYLVVNGRSMEPTLYTYDLAVIKQADRYEVGDILAFQVGDGLVIHRAIDGDQDSGFVMQGDNRNSVDPWEPNRDSIVGQYVIDIPMGGYVVSWLGQPIVFGIAVAAISILGGGFGGKRVVARRRRKRMNQSGDAPKSNNPGPGVGQWWPRSQRMIAVFIGATVVGTLLASLTGYVFWTPAERSEYVEEVAYDHTSTFDYRAQLEPSTLYPDGRLAPVEGDDGAPTLPQPMYTALANTVTVDYQYELKSQLPPIVTGQISADLVIEATDGWSRTEPLMSPRSFEGPSTNGQFTVDFRAVRALIDQVEAETSFSPAQYTLSVQPHITLNGNLGSHSVEETYSPAFDIQYTRSRITPPTELELSENVSVGEDVIMANQLAVLGIDQSVGAWRWISVIGTIVALGIAGAVALVSYLGFGQPEPERVHARYGRMLVPVQTNGSTPSATSIHVGSMSYLARLAQRDGGIIFHESGPAVHRYFVRDGQDTYDYMVPVSRNGASAHPDAAESTEN